MQQIRATDATDHVIYGSISCKDQREIDFARLQREILRQKNTKLSKISNPIKFHYTTSKLINGSDEGSVTSFL